MFYYYYYYRFTRQRRRIIDEPNVRSIDFVRLTAALTDFVKKTITAVFITADKLFCFENHNVLIILTMTIIVSANRQS